MDIYNEEQINQAITRVEEAKKNHPVGWEFLRELNLPMEDIVSYIWENANAHVERLGREEDQRIIYSAGWLNGVAIGVALGENRKQGGV